MGQDVHFYSPSCASILPCNKHKYSIKSACGKLDCCFFCILKRFMITWKAFYTGLVTFTSNGTYIPDILFISVNIAVFLLLFFLYEHWAWVDSSSDSDWKQQEKKERKRKKTWDISGVCFKLHQTQDIARKFALLTDKILQLKGQAVNYYL